MGHACIRATWTTSSRIQFSNKRVVGLQVRGDQIKLRFYMVSSAAYVKRKKNNHYSFGAEIAIIIDTFIQGSPQLVHLDPIFDQKL